jgi:membrane associated rhomboid family serine protease
MQEPQRFPVRFHSSRVGQPANAFELAGKGLIEIGDGYLTLRGSRHRTLRPPTPAVETIHLVNVVNVWRDGKQIGCMIQTGEGNRQLAFAAADFPAAQAIQTLLPTRQTEAFATEQADFDAFHHRMDHWSPNSPATFALLAAIVIVHGLMMIEPGAATPVGHARQLVNWGSNAGPLTLNGEYWRLITAMFLHGGLAHLLFNAFALYQLGRLVERMFGTPRFLLLYLLSGIAGGLASVWWNPAVNSVGASGAIFGLMGGMLAFIRSPHSGVPITVVKSLRGSAMGFLLFNVVAGLIYPYTDNAAHFGGLVGGYLFGFLLARSLHVPAPR